MGGNIEKHVNIITLDNANICFVSETNDPFTKACQYFQCLCDLKFQFAID